MFGEDFTSDPVSRVLGYVLHYFSKGHLAINVQLVSQVWIMKTANLHYRHHCQRRRVVPTLHRRLASPKAWLQCKSARR